MSASTKGLSLAESHTLIPPIRRWVPAARGVSIPRVILRDWPSSTGDGWTLTILMTGRDCPASRWSV